MFKRITSIIFVFVLFFQTAFSMDFNPSDLPVVDGTVYHLRLSSEQLAPNVIIVGDPERVPVLARACLETITSSVSHRGLATITGVTTTGLPITIVTSGMGTGSTEIVINEIMALNEIDLVKRKRRAQPVHSKLNIVRLGTSGGLQADTPLGMPIISAIAVGLDNTGLFYQAPLSDGVLELETLCKNAIDTAMTSESRFVGKINPYAAYASGEMVESLRSAAQDMAVACKYGITVSNGGFFANQGRNIAGIPLSVPEIDICLSRVEFHGLKVENMEMEASCIFHFFHGLNQRADFGEHKPLYRAGAVCPAIANRHADTFDIHYEENVLVALNLIVQAFERLQVVDCE